MSEQNAPLPLFISYSHQDDEWRARLDTHLALLKRQRVFDVWHDRRIGAGKEWAGEIDEALERAAVVLLIISADFLDSDYCYDKEMKRALQRHKEGAARVVPVIVRPCDWRSSDFGKLQAVPKDGKAIASHRDMDDAMAQVAEELRKVASKLQAARQKGLRDPDGEGSADSPPKGPVPRTLKPGLVKIGPFKIAWPYALSGVRLLWMVAALGGGLAAISGLVYYTLLKNPLDEADTFLRRGEYASAAGSLAGLPGWSDVLRPVKARQAQAAFGVRLEQGAHIRSLVPELSRLEREYPQDPEVLVFLGLKAYWVDQDPEQAARLFAQAAERDEAHVAAHFLAASRYEEMAYLALSRDDAGTARKNAEHAHQLVSRAMKNSPFVADLPNYANQIAGLDEFLGNTAQAYKSLVRLAPMHSLSAVESAFLAWRLPEFEVAVRDSQELVETAVATIERHAPDHEALEGWNLRLSTAGILTIRTRDEKLCLLGRVLEVTQSLRAAGAEGGTPNDAVAATVAKASAKCGSEALAQRILEPVCVQVLTSLDRISAADARRPVLESWATARLGCAQGLRALPALPTLTPSTTTSGVDLPTGRHT